MFPLVARAGAGHGPDFEVIWTWCPAAAGGAPLRPWSRVVRLLAGGHAAAAQLVDGSPFLSTLAGRAGYPASNPAGDLPDPEGARSQLSLDLAEVFAAVAAERPVLVIVDDAHHADTSSLRLLAELARQLARYEASTDQARAAVPGSVRVTFAPPQSARRCSGPQPARCGKGVAFPE